jgi:uroporphyrinogen-III synthase
MAQSMARAIYLLSPTPKEGVHHLPMIRFKITAEKIDFSCCDTLLFSSKQAVKSAEQIDPTWKTYPCIAIGGATKKQIEVLGGEVIHYPKHFYADVLAEDIVRLFSRRKLLYLRPQKISFDSKGFLAAKGIDLQEQIIYETSCISYLQEEAPQERAIIIFTSPSSIHCFLKNFTWKESYTAVVIGRATQVHLPKGADCIVANEPLINACIAKAKELQSY